MLLILLVLSLCAASPSLAGPNLRVPSGFLTEPVAVRPHHRLMRPALDEDSLHRFDVLKIEPHLRFDLDHTTLRGYTAYDIAADQIPLDRIDFRFTQSLTVDSVWTAETLAVSFATQGDDSLQIYLSPAPPVGDTVRVMIAYHGSPATIDSWGGFRWGQEFGWRPQIAFSMGDGLSLDPPPANYNWIPTHADPTDKVLWEAWLRVPANRVVTSDGMRLDTVQHEDTTVTWHYRLDHPVSTYLLSIAVSDYVIQTQRESGPLIENFVYPSRVNQALTHFSNVPTVLDGFAQLFGPYPFDRFGYAMTRIGDMEHATCVYHIDAAVAANHNYDWLLFHEMSHQWWGDWVTCGDWRDLWINEGFGTYCEALGMEILYGPYEYHDYVVNDLFQTALTTPESFPIYDPDYYWGATVYEKGACVQHMLRQLLGDTAFFQAWREFGQEHAWGNAVTTDWQAKLEQHYGDSLGWFFGPWVYGRRYPQYHVILEIGDVVNLIIQQQQTTGTYFRMPLEIQMLDADGDTGLFRLWNDAIDEEAWMIMPGDSTYHVRPTAVMLDPFDKVLKTVTYEVRSGVAEPPALPLEFRLTGIYPNPFNAAATLRFDLPRALSVNLTVFDVLARSVSRQCFGPLTAGRHEVRWDGTPFASGVYVFRLETAAGARVAKAVLLK